MKRIWSALLAIALCLLLVPHTSAAGAAATVTAYDAAVAVQTDGSVDVQARITVHISGTFDTLTIPLGANATACALGGEEFTKTTVDGIVCLVVERAAGLSGDQTFQVSYSLPSCASRSAGGQIFDLKLLPAAWDYALDKYAVTVTFPKSFTATPQFSSGYYGENVDNYLNISLQEGVLSVQTTEKLRDHDELRLYLELPADYFTLPSAASRAQGFCRVGFWLLLVLCLLYWFVRLRSPLFFPAVRRLPPLSATAGEIGFQITCDRPDLPLLTVHWATMGYLSIYRNRNGRILLRKKMDMGNERKRAEQKLFAALFAKEPICDVQSARFRRISESADRMLSAYWGRRLFRRSSGSPYLLRLLSLLAGALVLLMSFDALLPSLPLRSILLLLLTVPASALFVLVRRGCTTVLRRERQLPLLLGAASLLLLLFLGSRAGTSIFMLLALLLELFVSGVTLFGGRRREFGQDILQQLLGFRRYLRGASRAQMLRALHIDRQFYYSTLPIADALGLASAFTGHFRDVTLEDCPWLDTAEGVPHSAQEFYEIYRELLRAMHGKEATTRAGRRILRAPKRRSAAPRTPARRAPAPQEAPQREPATVAAPPEKPHIRPHRRPEYDVDYNEFGDSDT